MGEARIIHAEQEKRAVQQQQMADLVEASKLPATFVNCFTLQEGGPNAVRFVFSDQFAHDFRPTPRTAVIMDLAMFRNMIESCNGVIRKLDEAAAHAKAAEEPKTNGEAFGGPAFNNRVLGDNIMGEARR